MERTLKLKLTRKEYTAKSTIGDLDIDGKFFCYTLEDRVRAPDMKVPGKTAIPAGTYKVVINFSHKYGRRMPQVLDVPNFEGIRIHSGNTDADTSGCILLGQTKGQDVVGLSRLAYAAFFQCLADAIENGEEVTLEIINTQEPVA